MGQKTYWHKVVWCLAIAFILASSLQLIGPLPAAAQSAGEYFQISYDPVSFNKDENQGSGLFYASIRGRATCTKNLPMSAKEARFTSRVVGEHTVSGTAVTLNSSYTIEIKPFPSKKGDTFEINQAVPLQFPAQAEPGDYNVTGELIEAKVKVVSWWLDVTEYLPQTQLMGSLKYTTPVSTPTPAPSPKPTPEATPTPAPAESGIGWWVWLIVALAVASAVATIIWRMRRTA